MVDEPKGIKRTYGYATGGWVAAPAVANVIKRMAPLLGLKKTENKETDFKLGDDLFISVQKKSR
jgi:cell division protein FtsI (penicillin-binding protein 3)